MREELIEQFRKKVYSQLPFSANEGQRNAVTKVGSFIFESDDRSLFILKGYAGTGKTNLISAVTKVLPDFRWRSVLLAPTGRAAKVLSYFAQRPAYTIHKKIFWPDQNAEGDMRFTLAQNLHRNTLFIVDEASMISAGSGDDTLFNNLLENLLEYVYSGDNCRLLLMGDPAQLPPVGSNESPALDPTFMRSAFHLSVDFIELTEVARQSLESGILMNATRLRAAIGSEAGFTGIVPQRDVIPVGGEDLEDVLNTAISQYGEDNVIIITRSNKRANLFNKNYRYRIRFYEDDLCTGDKIMVVKNNYYWIKENTAGIAFIANGDMAEIRRIISRESRYGFDFCDCLLRFTDYPELPDQQVQMITNSLYSDNPALKEEELKALYANVMQDVTDEPLKGARRAYLKNNPYYNALQVKFRYAVTCHKSQGGQWPVVFIDHGYLEEGSANDELIRWLYTAITRASEKVYLISFKESLLDQKPAYVE
jgi:exodeoxyribonuclease V